MRMPASSARNRGYRHAVLNVIMMLLFLVVPLAAVFYEALRKGFDAYLAALQEPDALSAIKLTLFTAAIAVSGAALAQAPANLFHFVFSNGLYESSGNQPLPGQGKFSFIELARAAGYPHTLRFTEAEKPGFFKRLFGGK